MIFDRSMLARNLIKEVVLEDCYGIRKIRDTPFECIVDIGANYGLFAIYSRFTWPNATIHAVEPHEETYKGLVSNVANLDIRTYRCALGDGNPVMTRQAGVSSGVVVTESSSSGVPSYRLPDLLKHLGSLPYAKGYLKVDTEGAERFIFGDGASEDLLCAFGGFGMEIHFRTAKWPHSPTREEWIRILDRVTKRLAIHGVTAKMKIGNNIGYFSGIRSEA